MEHNEGGLSFEELTAVDMVEELDGEVAEILGNMRSDLAIICKEIYLMSPEQVSPETIQLINQKVTDLKKLLTRED